MQDWGHVEGNWAHSAGWIAISPTLSSTSNIPTIGVAEDISSIRSRRLRLSRCRCTPGSKRPSGVEIPEPLQPVRRLRLRFGKAQGSQAARFGCGAEEKDPAGVPADRHHRRGLAHLSPHRGNDACGDGRTPTHNPRLSTTRQPSRHEQVLAGDIEDEASSTGQIGRCDPAGGLPAETEPSSIGGALQRVRSRELGFGAYRPLISPDSLGPRLVSDWKIWRGRRDSNSRPLP